MVALGALGCGGKDSPPSLDAGMDAVGECPPGEPPIAPSLLPVCNLCPDARCVPNFALDDDQVAMLAPCDDNNTCVPELFIETNGQFLLTRCTSLLGAEGRCLSPCIPAVSSQAHILPADVCENGWLCAPCYDPLTGEDTGACSQSCDTGPTEAARTFPECCGGLGSCVPTSLVGEDQSAQLGVDTCTGDDILCAPKDLADPTYTPPRCDSVAGVEGRCLPECLPDIQAQASLLPQSTCAEAHLCAPCYDPTTAEDTGACRLNGDEPEDPPAVFERCCMDLGSCVPVDLVPPEQQGQLGEDICTEPGTLCAPDSLANPSFIPPACASVAGAEGRCLPECLPDIGAQADLLPQDICPTHHLCAPCYDPLSGEDTGACRINGDEPGQPPVIFDRCCSGRGACVPDMLVPNDQRGQLGQDTCTDAGDLCAPDNLAMPTYVPPTCRSVADVEGRCMPDCLPDIAAQADLLPRSTCAEGDLCAPCYDPTNGEDTGACRINGDEPAEPPFQFERCCGDRGMCVPVSLVPEGQQDQLGSDTCSDGSLLCAPDDLANPTYTPPTCRSVADVEGRCMPDCLPDIAAQADLLPQSTCDEGELCAPCYDPTNGDDTGACRINDDEPVEPPFQFERCCSDRGMCVPSSLVPVDQQSQLGPDTCTGGNLLCAPDDLADPGFVPPTCSSVGGFEGRCLPDCLPDIAAQAGLLPQDVCNVGDLCAPCYDPITGADTGACRLNGDEPTEPPGTFDRCCGDRGSCVPVDLVPPDQQGQLGPDTCTQGGMVCAPDDLADPIYVPPSCNSIAGAEGRCLPDCLPDIAAQADRLPQDSCMAGELCAPCYDPLTGDDTGACRLNGDEPVDPPFTFERCCTDRGSCVPAALVPPEQQGQLGPDTCAEGGLLCAPDAFVEPTYIPPSCSSIAGAEGRCLPDCLPDIAAQADRLPQDLCDPGNLCAPCYDPLTGSETGACSINGDEPSEPPIIFDRCCNDRGACVPDYLVPPDQQGQLGSDTCSGSGDLCAPDNLADSTYTPPFCASVGGGEGRCLPDCLPDIQAQADMLEQSTCAAGELCAPCYNPIDGEDTGACRLNGDAPTQPPYVFGECCGGLSLCVPESLVPEEQRQHLDGQGCGTGELCAPKVFILDPDYQPASCTAQLDITTLCIFPISAGPGVCLPACLPALRGGTGSFLCRGNCPSNWKCAPCNDPLTGAPTGACDL
jgi:hypothetical protein